MVKQSYITVIVVVIVVVVIVSVVVIMIICCCVNACCTVKVTGDAYDGDCNWTVLVLILWKNVGRRERFAA